MSSFLDGAVITDEACCDNPDPGALPLLLQIANTHPEVLRLVINRMPERSGAALLRLGNRSLRLAVNRTVTTVTCVVSRGLPLVALDSTFPVANRLRVVLSPDADPHLADEHDTVAPDEAAASTDAAVHADAVASDAAAARAAGLIEGLWRSSPGLLRKISVLEVSLETDSLSPDPGSTVAALVCGCSSLESLHVSASHYPGVDIGVGDGDDDSPLDRPTHFIARFQGRGSTPAERCAHLQRQLAALPGCSDFLAPASWPSCSGLEALNLLLLELTPRHPLFPHMDAALQTTSLRRLWAIVETSGADAGSDMLHLHRISTLTSLTFLRLWSYPAHLPAPALAAIPCLQDLVTLDLGSKVEVTPDLCRTLGALRHLTQLSLRGQAAAASPAPLAADIPHLPSLFSRAAAMPHLNLQVQGSIPPLLNLLARWCVLTGPIYIHLAVSERTAKEHLAVKGWNTHWLASFLGSHSSRGLPLALADDDDVDSFLSALRSANDWQPQWTRPVCLGAAVSVEAMGRLLCCGPLPNEPVGLVMTSDGALLPHGWNDTLQLTIEHLAAALAQDSSAVNLNSLVSSGEPSGEGGKVLAAMKRTAGGMWDLTVQTPSAFQGMGLGALASGSMRLSRVSWSVDGAGVAAEAVLSLFSGCGGLEELPLRGIDEAAAKVLIADVRRGQAWRRMPEGSGGLPGRAWALEGSWWQRETGDMETLSLISRVGGRMLSRAWRACLRHPNWSFLLVLALLYVRPVRKAT